jgi:hypothetical protein
MASGDTLALFNVGGAVAESGAAYAREYGMDVAVLSNTDTGPSIRFLGLVPRQYGGTGITVVVAWYANAASDLVRLNVSIDRLSNGTILSSSSFATPVVVTANAPATTRKIVYSSFVLTSNQADQIAAGDLFAVKVSRDNTISGNLAGLVMIAGVSVKES